LYDIILNPIKTDDQIGFIGHCLDITDNIKTQNDLSRLKRNYTNIRDELKEINQKTDLIIQNSNIGIWEWDAKTDKVEISGPIFTILCYEPNRDDSEALFWSLFMIRKNHIENLMGWQLVKQTNSMKTEPNRDDSEALFWSLVYPQDQEKSYRKFNGLAIGKTNQFHENFRVKHRDGHFFISIPLVLL
jgi:PAS domain-containing protein